MSVPSSRLRSSDIDPDHSGIRIDPCAAYAIQRRNLISELGTAELIIGFGAASRERAESSA